MTIEDFKSLLRFRVKMMDGLIKDQKQIQYNTGRKDAIIDILYDLESVTEKEEPQD